VAAEDPEGPVYLLQVTPAALKGLNQYQKELSVRGIPPEVVKTVLSFDTDASFPKLKFGFGGFLEAGEQDIVDRLFGSDEVKEITGEKLITSQSAEAAAPVPAPVAPRPAPVKVVEEAPAPAPEAAETPKRGFGAAKTAPKVAKPKPAPAVAEEATNAMTLADEIAALVGGLDADDE